MNHPSREQSLAWLAWAQEKRPGRWVDHVRTAARAAEAIAGACGMDAELAWHMGLLHDIGRFEEMAEARHTIAGYNFLMQKGYPALSRICLTHSFPSGNPHECNGAYDVTQEELACIEALLDMDDYDKLIQLCDAISLPQGVCLMEKRLIDVVMRHGLLPEIMDKWRAFFEIKADFEARLGHSIYRLFEEAARVTFEE